MIILRIDDVGRRVGDRPEQGSDGSLEYFDWWRQECGMVGTPALYGAVVSWLEPNSVERIQLSPEERWAVHGFDHVRGSVVSAKQMEQARARLNTEVYIPPFNVYDRQTIQNWEIAGGRYFLGGYEQRVAAGELPTRLGAVAYVPAYQMLYGRSRELLNRLPEAPKHPLVLTLHVPWEIDPGPVAELMNKIRDKLIPIEEVDAWL